MTPQNNPHPLLNENETLTELEDLHFTKQKTRNRETRYRCLTSMSQHHLETILRHQPNGNIHRTTTIFNDHGHITNQTSETIETSLDQLDRKNVKTILNNYMTNQAHLETRKT